MKLPLQITFRDLDPMPTLEEEIRRRVSALERWAPDLMSCQVAVKAEGNRHRQGRVFRVSVTLRLSDGELATGAHPGNDDVYLAMRGSFDALDRQLEEHLRRRRGEVKHHEP